MAPTIPPNPAPAAEDEPLIATFAVDRAAFQRGQGLIGLLGGLILAAFLLFGLNPWVRYAAYALLLGTLMLAGWHDAGARDWRLTSRHLLGPGGRVVPLPQVVRVRRVLNAVQVLTRDGGRHLLLYQPDPQTVVATILAARRGA